MLSKFETLIMTREHSWSWLMSTCIMTCNHDCHLQVLMITTHKHFQSQVPVPIMIADPCCTSTSHPVLGEESSLRLGVLALTLQELAARHCIIPQLITKCSCIWLLYIMDVVISYPSSATLSRQCNTGGKHWESDCSTLWMLWSATPQVPPYQDNVTLVASTGSLTLTQSSKRLVKSKQWSQLDITPSRTDWLYHTVVALVGYYHYTCWTPTVTKGCGSPESVADCGVMRIISSDNNYE